MEGEVLSPIAQLLARTPVPLFVGTMDGVVVACNDAAGSLLRTPVSEIVGQPVTAFDTGRSPDRVGEMHRELASGAAARTNSVYRRGDGTLVLVEAEVLPCLWNGRRHFLGLVLPMADLLHAGADNAVDAFSDRGGMVIVCAWCRRVYEHPGRWVVRDILALSLPVSHGMCPSCFDQILPPESETHLHATLGRGA